MPPKAPAKQYKYYTDAFEQRNQKSVESDDVPPEQRRPLNLNSPPMSATQKTQNPGPSALPVRQRQRQTTPHEEAKPAFDKRPATASLEAERPRANTTKMTKKPFLKRGTGTARGLTALQKSSRPPVPGKMESKPAHEVAQAEADQHPARSGRMDGESMDEFEQIEQACSGPLVRNEQEQRQMASPGRGVQNRSNAPGQKRKKKLFDDSDSEEQAPEDDDEDHRYRSNKGRDARSPHSPSRSPAHGNQGRSNLVNKLFYKDQKSQRDGSKKQGGQHAYQEGEARKQELAASDQLNEQMQALLGKKQEELEKAIDQFNAENEQLGQQKVKYDQMIRKLKVEQRELEGMKKRQQEDVDRLKEDEMQKVRKEKRALEQRQKNFQLVSNTAKKEREEIDQLRREYNKYRADAELKAKKQAS